MTQRQKKSKAKKTSVSGEPGPRSGTNAASGMKWDFVMVAILIAAYFLRSLDLDMKPPHFDEGINGHFVAKMWREGYYHYDPTNFHGPLYFYVLMLSELFLGSNIVAYRYVNGLISVGVVYLVFRHRRFFGAAAVWAGAVVALSSAFVFYSRYAIHETLFVFMQLLFSYGWLLWAEEKSRRSFALMAVGLTGAFALKETWFIFFGTWLIAAGIVRLHDWLGSLAKGDATTKLGRMLQYFLFGEPRLRAAAESDAIDEGSPVPDKDRAGFWRAKATRVDLIAVSLASGLFAAAMFTGFFINMRGLADMITSLQIWAKTGTGNSGHEKPFGYWLELLNLYELPTLFALFAAIPMYFIGDKRLKIMALTGFGLWLAYSIIPYKTPWLIMNFIWPLAFVFGAMFAIATRPRESKSRWPRGLASGIVISVAIPIFWRSAQDMYRVAFREYTNEKEKYVYVQTTSQMKRLVDLVEAHVARFPEDLNMRLLVLVKDPWPLPWIFGLYPKLTYGKVGAVELTAAAVVLIDDTDRADLERKLRGKYWRIPFQIRDSYEKGSAYLEFDKFKDLVPNGSELFHLEEEKP